MLNDTGEKINEREERLKKLAELKNKGLNPYPAKVNRDYEIAKVISDFEKLLKSAKDVAIVGRLRSIRSHGNLTFANLEDGSANIQIALSKKELGDESYKDFVKLIDHGDFIQVKGNVFNTHKGEQSVMVKSWTLLSKALRPIPDAWFGLKDEEERYRKRYLDLILNPETRDIFYKRAKFWEVTRQFMKKHGFIDVETPTLEITTGGADANPFKTHHDDYDQDIFLRISVGELWQKRLMAAGYEKTFEIGRVIAMKVQAQSIYKNLPILNSI